MHSGGHGSRVHDSLSVTPHPYLTKSLSSKMTRSSQLYLTRLVDGLAGFQPSSLVAVVLKGMLGVVWTNAHVKVPDV